jgi:hypothetical protein
MNRFFRKDRHIGLNIYIVVVSIIALSDALLKFPLIDILYSKNYGVLPLEIIAKKKSGYSWLLNIYSWEYTPHFLLTATIIFSISLIFSNKKIILMIILCMLIYLTYIRNLGILDGSDSVILVLFPFLILAYITEFTGILIIRTRIKNYHIIEKYLQIIESFAVIGFLIQVCIIYIFTALYKLNTTLWQDGTALYYAMRIDEYCMTEWNIILTKSSFFVKSGTYFTLLWEILFPIFVWFKRTKWIIIILGITFHVLIYFFMRIGDFSWIMIGCYAVFITDKEYHKVWLLLKHTKLTSSFHR